MSYDRPLPGHALIRQVSLWLDYQSGSWFHRGDLDSTVEEVIELYHLVRGGCNQDLIEDAWDAATEKQRGRILELLHINPESQTARNIRKYCLPHLSE